MNSREKLAHVAEWLGWQDEGLSASLHNAFDALRLYDYAQANCELGEMADEWEPGHRIAALGYDPLSQGYVEAESTGAFEATAALRNAYVLIDSVAFLKGKGDTLHILAQISRVLSIT